MGGKDWEGYIGLGRRETGTGNKSVGVGSGPGISCQVLPYMEECLEDVWEGTHTLFDLLQGLQDVHVPPLRLLPSFLDF